MMIIAVIHHMHEVALSFLNASAEFKKDCMYVICLQAYILSSNIFLLLLPYTSLPVTLVYNTIYSVPMMLL